MTPFELHQSLEIILPYCKNVPGQFGMIEAQHDELYIRPGFPLTSTDHQKIIDLGWDFEEGYYKHFT